MQKKVHVDHTPIFSLLVKAVFGKVYLFSIEMAGFFDQQCL